MLLSKPFQLLVLSTSLLLVASIPLTDDLNTRPNAITPPIPNAAQPIALLDKRAIYNWGPYRAWIWRSAAVLPAMAAVPDMKRFWTDMAIKGSELSQNAVIMNNFDHALGALQILMSTADGSPIDFDFVTFLGSKMMQLTAMGWTDHFVATFTDLRTQRVVVVMLQAVVGAGMSTMGSLLSGLDSAGQSFKNPGPNGGAPGS